jgi:hypothetical protein
MVVSVEAWLWQNVDSDVLSEIAEESDHERNS